MAIPDVLIMRQVKPLAAVAGITGAAPQTVNGAAIDLNDVVSGTLSAYVRAKADTNTLTLTGKWQAQLKDGATWVDVANDANNPAGVAFATGTAGVDAAVDRIFPAPQGIYAYRRARFVVTSGVASGGGAGTDEVSRLEYSYVRPTF